MTSRAVVIGGGISGLATAALLAREGRQVTLLEKNETLGGRAGSWEQDGFRFDTGPSWYLMPEVFDHFFKLMGTSADQELDLVRLDPGYRVYTEGDTEPIDIAASREENIALFESLEPGSGARMEAYLDSAAETYGLAKEHFLYSTFDQVRPLLVGPVLKRFPRLVRLLTENLMSFAGRTVHDDRLQKILGYPGVFLGTSPYSAPSMYHLMSHLDLADGVLYPRGGFTSVISAMERIARKAGVEIITGAEATRIVLAVEAQAAAEAITKPADPYDYPTTEFDTTVLDRDELRRMLGAEYEPAATVPAAIEPPRQESRGQLPHVGGVNWSDAEGRAHSIEADLVVSTADLHHSETELLLPELQTYPEAYWEKRVAGPSAVLILLGVRGELPQLEHHTLFFTKDWRSNFRAIFDSPPGTAVPDPASIYVCRPSASDPAVAPDGEENLFVLVPLAPDVSLGRGGVDGDGDPRIETIADAAIEQIADWAGIPDLAARILVRRTVGPADFADDFHAWKGTALGPAHTLRQSAMFRAKGVSSKVDGLYYAGASTMPGVGLPMCLISAELVIKRLRGDVSTSPLAEPLEPLDTVDRMAPGAPSGGAS